MEIEKVYFRNKHMVVWKYKGLYNVTFFKNNLNLFYECQGSFWWLPKLQIRNNKEDKNFKFGVRIGWGYIALGINQWKEKKGE